MKPGSFIALCLTLATTGCESRSKPGDEVPVPDKEQHSPEAPKNPTGESPGGEQRGVARRAFGGEMQYMADAALFTECATGRPYPMAMEADFRAAERAYREAVEEPGAKLYVTFEGTVSERPAVDRQGTEENVVVERFIHAWPDERCERAKADASFVNTRWRIVRIGDVAIGVEEGKREPHLTIKEMEGALRYQATVGCNQIVGAAELGDPTVAFKPGPMTRMACPPPLDEHERALVTMLSRAKRYRVLGNTLELFDESGQSLALFRAVYL